MKNRVISDMQFILDIPELGTMSFLEVTGLENRRDIIQYRTGADRHITSIPGLSKIGTVTLKHPITNNKAMYNWFENFTASNDSRCESGSIKALESGGKNVIAEWHFHGAWPRSYETPQFTVEEKSYAIEQFDLVCDRLIRVK